MVSQQEKKIQRRNSGNQKESNLPPCEKGIDIMMIDRRSVRQTHVKANSSNRVK
jgi:hypothetical protein